MKKKLLLIFSAFLLVFLTGCGNLKNSDLANNATTTTKKKTYQTTATGSDNYNVLLKDGVYQTSKIAGMTATNNGNSVDLNNLESGLIQFSLTQFSNDKYVFQEGQQLSRKTVNAWLTRYNKDSNKLGLNPEDNGQTDADKRNPIYLEQIIEGDFLTTDNNNGYQLAGISLGLAMNSVDYYTKETDGPQFKTEISREKQLAQGKEMANQIVKRLRAQKEYQDIPITIGIFSKTAADSLVGGSYLAYGTSAAKTTEIKDYTTVNEKSQVLPTVGDATPISSKDAEAFANFKEEIESYFPQISGVIGKVKYQDDKLARFDITVNTQFFGYEQINSFSKLTLSAAKKFLPSNVPVEIIIQSVNDSQAVIFKNDADSEYQLHVMNKD